MTLREFMDKYGIDARRIFQYDDEPIGGVRLSFFLGVDHVIPPGKIYTIPEQAQAIRDMLTRGADRIAQAMRDLDTITRTGE